MRKRFIYKKRIWSGHVSFAFWIHQVIHFLICGYNSLCHILMFQSSNVNILSLCSQGSSFLQSSEPILNRHSWRSWSIFSLIFKNKFLLLLFQIAFKSIRFNSKSPQSVIFKHTKVLKSCPSIFFTSFYESVQLWEVIFVLFPRSSTVFYPQLGLFSLLLLSHHFTRAFPTAF